VRDALVGLGYSAEEVRGVLGQLTGDGAGEGSDHRRPVA